MIEYSNVKHLQIIVKDSKIITCNGLFYTKGDFNKPEEINLSYKLNEILNADWQIRVQNPIIFNIFPKDCFLFFEYIKSISVFNNMVVIEV